MKVCKCFCDTRQNKEADFNTTEFKFEVVNGVDFENIPVLII